MRQLAIICCLIGTFVLWGCGGHKKTPPTPPAKVTVDVTGLSLTFGEIFTLAGASVHLVDASGNILSTAPAFTVSSSNTNLVTINGSEICGGIFNGNATVCNAKDANGNLLTAGSATITVSAQGVNSDPIPVSVHQKVTSAAVVLDKSNNPPPGGCTSQTGTLKYTLIACSAGSVSGNGCTNGGADISPSLGTITWNTSDTNIASVAADGTVTSKLPGAVNVKATVGNVNSVNPTPALFVACPPKTISIHVTGVADKTFSLNPTDPNNPTTTVKLDADVTDTAGQPITGAALTWSSFNPASATVGTDGTVTQAAPGTTSIVASCTPPTCNNAPGVSPQPIPTGTGSPVFSNLVTGSVAGTSAPAVYATAPTTDGTLSGATANTTLLTIDPAHPDTPQSVTLPHPANSMVFDRQGLKAYLGTTDGHGIMQFDPNSPTTAPTVLGDGTITGAVIAVSRDGTRIVVSDTAAGKVFVYNTAATSNNIETYTLSGVADADFALNSSNGFFASPAGGQFYIPGKTFPLSLGTDVKYLPQGSVAYFSGDPSVTTKPFTGISTCTNAGIETGSNAAKVWGVATDGSHLVGANATGWLDLATSSIPAGLCPTTFNSNAKAVSFGSPSFVGTPTQVAATPNSKKVFMTGFTRASGATTSGIPVYDIASGTAKVVTTGIPADAQVFSGGITLDGNALYVGVGGSAPGIYKVDPAALTATPLAVPSSSLTFVPSIVTVRPK